MNLYKHFSKTLQQWNSLFYVFAMINIVTIGSCLFITQRTTQIYSASVDVNTEWSERLDQIAELERYIHQAKKHRFNAFAEHNYAKEQKQLMVLHQAFIRKHTEISRDLEQNLPPDLQADMRQLMDSIYNDFVRLSRHSESIFTLLAENQTELARSELMILDEKILQTQSSLDEISRMIAGNQQRNFNSQLDITKRIRAYVVPLSGLVLLISIGLLGYSHVVSRKLKETQSKSWENEKQLNRILEKIPTGVILVDEQGIIRQINAAIEEMFGFTREELTDHPLTHMLPEQYRANHFDNFSRFLEAPYAIHMGNGRTFYGQRSNGEVFPIDLGISAIESDGKKYALASLIDITEYKEYENDLRDSHDTVAKAQQKLENYAQLLELQNLQLEEERKKADAANTSKSSFLANMSHEIRTPMTAILGYTDILVEESGNVTMPPEHLKALHTIRRNGEHLLEIINDILDLSKIEANKMTVEKIEVSPHQLLDDIHSLMSVRSEEKQIDLIVNSEGGIPDTIQSDPTRLRQILLNLVGNSIKFTQQGSVSVMARFKSDTENPLLQIDIIDTGIGLKPEQMKNLFTPFTQADESLTRKFGGTGLGLTISKRLAKKLGGDIEIVKSELNAGTTFRLTIATGPVDEIPLSEYDSQRMDSEAEADETRPKEARTLPADCRVLLAEDGLDNQRLISFLLKKAGVRPTVVENGELAVETAFEAMNNNTPFDVILMDMQMPVLDGYEATSILREQDYGLPVVALTAHAMSGDREKCLAAGCDAFLTKPLNRDAMLSAINELYHQARSIPLERC